MPYSIFGLRGAYTATWMVFALYLGAAASVFVIYGLPSPVSPASAVALAGVLLAGRRVLPAIFLAAFLASLLFQASGVLPALLIALGNTLGPWFALRQLRRTSAEDLFAGHVGVIRFLLFGGLLNAGVAAFLGVSGVLLFGDSGEWAPLMLALTWFVADLTAVLMLAPFFYFASRLFQGEAEPSGGAAPLEVLLVSTVLIAGSLVVFLVPGGGNVLSIGAMALAMLPLVWAALRFPPWIVFLQLALLFVIAVSGTSLGSGPLDAYPRAQALTALQLMGAAVAAAILLATALDRERRHMSQALEQMNRELARRVADRTAELAASRGALRSQVDFQQALIDAIPNPVYYKDAEGRFRLVNHALCEAVGLKREAVEGHTSGEVFGEYWAQFCDSSDEDARRTGRGELEMCIGPQEVEADERRAWSLVKGALGDGSIVGTMHDITEQRHLHKAMAESEARTWHLLETVPMPMLVSNPDNGKVVFINDAGASLFALSRTTALGGRMLDLWVDLSERDRLIERLRRGETVRGMELPFRDAQGEMLWLSVSAVMTTLDGEEAALFAFKDISVLKEREAQLIEQASTDSLTGLSNRRFFREQAEAELGRARRQQRVCALIMFDIDHFKRINDTRGHACGDEAIRRIADLARAGLRESDRLARWGGEEFILLLPETARDEALRIAERLRVTVAASRTRCESPEPLAFTASFGLAMFDPQVAETLDGLIERADQALYRAKRNGRDRVEMD
ncbi:MAG: diguanylate cyclase [Halothiobacillaceae bacterium]|jgi:diguanylate cyclase (GGDEF)-like protein/PAS domain S-box-containing protein|nr:diguanylate cyclase [Halothiobacillaceae bacterium]MDY0050148.1 diguanylate cyclase [Halothiobacillaceae bacterium]